MAGSTPVAVTVTIPPAASPGRAHDRTAESTAASGSVPAGAASVWAQLHREIEDLRAVLYDLARTPDDLRRADVLAVSQRLDALIVRAQRALAQQN